MTLLSIVVCVIGFYLLYNISKRANVREDRFSLWFQRHPVLSATLGLSLLIISFVVLIVEYGLGTGTLFGFTILMTIGSLVILLTPLMKTHARES